MEDEHIAVPLEPPVLRPGIEPPKMAMFGVWDGHGGREVARFVRVHMADELVRLEEYQSGDFEAALVRVFHRMDEMCARFLSCIIHDSPDAGEFYAVRIGSGTNQ